VQGQARFGGGEYGIFYFFFTFIYLYLPSLTLIDLYWNGSQRGFGGVFEGRRRVGGGILMGRKGQTGRKGPTPRSPGIVPRADRSGARAGWTSGAALR